MSHDGMQEASIPNPRLKPLEMFIGDWNTIGSHLYMPNIVLHGRVRFEWLEGGSFLMMRSEVDEPRIPSGIAIIGSDDAAAGYFMLYFDERGVSRRFDVGLENNVLRWSRNAPGFFQIIEAAIVDGNQMIGKSMLSKDDGLTWENDSEMTYTRRDG